MNELKPGYNRNQAELFFSLIPLQNVLVKKLGIALSNLNETNYLKRPKGRYIDYNLSHLHRGKGLSITEAQSHRRVNLLKELQILAIKMKIFVKRLNKSVR